MNSLKQNWPNYLILFVISLLSFNHTDHHFSWGLDASYNWAFNYLVNFNPSQLDKTTFIYGPLAFLHNPVCYGYIIVIGVVFQAMVKYCLGYCFFRMSGFLNFDKRLAFALFAVCCLTMFSVEAWVNLCIILLLVIFFVERKNLFLYLTCFLVAFGYYFKSSIALSGFLYIIIFLAYDRFAGIKTERKVLIGFFSALAGFWLVLGLLLFRGIGPVFDSLIIYYHNIISFNETSSFYNSPDNFILLALCFLAIILVFFINKDKVFRLFWMLCVLLLYTGYTHSMVRMDYMHYIGFLLYFFLVIVSCGLFYKLLSPYTFPLLAIAFFTYYGNLGNKWDYSDLIINIPNGPKNFIADVFCHNKNRAQYEKESIAGLKGTSSLKSTIVNELKTGSVDAFPWELSYIPANKLKNWKPRPYLQNLNMSPYFDKKTAEYFASSEAPDHLIWHFGMRNNFLEGIDDSYLFNNEFHSILSIMSHYKMTATDNSAIILDKRPSPLKIAVSEQGKEQEVNSEEGVKLPGTDAMLGCSVGYDFNILRGLKKLLYRDDQFFIEYKTRQGTKFKQRIWPSDAKDFVWLSPFMVNVHDSTGHYDVTEVRFLNTNKTIHSGKLKIRFKSLEIEGDRSKKALYKWFNGMI